VFARTAVTLASILVSASPLGAAAGEGTVLRAGSIVEFDLSGLPARYEGGGKVVCTGTTVTAVGPTAARCEREYRFEVPPGSTRTTYVFKAAQGGRESRVDLPVVRTEKPVTFIVPADGSLLSPGPAAIPPEAADAAAKATAEAECRKCKGGAFSVESSEVTQEPAPVGGTLSVKLRIKPALPPAAPAR